MLSNGTCEIDGVKAARTVYLKLDLPPYPNNSVYTNVVKCGIPVEARYPQLHVYSYYLNRTISAGFEELT